MKRLLLSAIVAIMSFVAVAADEARLLRFPGVGGETIVFSYAGKEAGRIESIKGGDGGVAVGL